MEILEGKTVILKPEDLVRFLRTKRMEIEGVTLELHTENRVLKGRTRPIGNGGYVLIPKWMLEQFQNVWVVAGDKRREKK